MKRNKKGQFVKGFPLTEEERNELSQIAKEKGFGKWMLGRKASPETREKLSEIKKGKNNPFYGKHHTEEAIEKNRQAHLGKCGSEAPQWKGGLPKCIDCGKELKSRYAERCPKCYSISHIGYKMPLAIREKLSEMKKGKNGSNWKGGISKENERIRRGIEFRLWREVVFTKDDFTCQKYKTKGCEIHPHHIKNFADYPELRFDVNNGITLSEKAHIEFHKKYGWENNNKEQLLNFLTIAQA